MRAKRIKLLEENIGGTGLVSIMYNELLEPNNEKTTQFKNEQRL